VAKQAISFCTKIWWHHGDGHAQTFTLQNSQTHEELVVKEEGVRLDISRHPIGTSCENLLDGIVNDWNYKYRTIEIYITKWKWLVETWP
jgi:hypothetical protein